MRPCESGVVPIRAIAIQLALLAGLMAFYMLYLPHREKGLAAAEAAEREKRIEKILPSLIVEDSTREVPTPYGAGRAHPQKLASAPTVDELEQALGVPDERTTDFRGGLHLIWLGTGRELEASFDHGRLYCLRVEDRRTGHGALIFESSWGWHPF